jgi:hypothetical protein
LAKQEQILQQSRVARAFRALTPHQT